MLLPDVVEELVADRPAHAVEDDQKHPIAGFDHPGDDLAEHILDAQGPCGIRAHGSPVRQGLGERPIELLPPLQDRPIEDLIGSRKANDLIHPGRSTPVPSPRRPGPDGTSG